jgi:hypothetical protein
MNAMFVVKKREVTLIVPIAFRQLLKDLPVDLRP